MAAAASVAEAERLAVPCLEDILAAALVVAAVVLAAAAVAVAALAAAGSCRSGHSLPTVPLAGRSRILRSILGSY